MTPDSEEAETELSSQRWVACRVKMLEMIIIPGSTGRHVAHLDKVNLLLLVKHTP